MILTVLAVLLIVQLSQLWCLLSIMSVVMPHAEATPAEAPAEPVRRTHIVASEAWSPEGWGPPDSEVITTEGDDFLARKHRPLPSDDV